MGQGTQDGNGTGRGTRDEGRSKKWEGEASAEPKRQRFANSDWRMGLEGSAPAQAKKFA